MPMIINFATMFPVSHAFDKFLISPSSFVNAMYTVHRVRDYREDKKSYTIEYFN